MWLHIGSKAAGTPLASCVMGSLRSRLWASLKMKIKNSNNWYLMESQSSNGDTETTQSSEKHKRTQTLHLLMRNTVH